MRTHTYECMCPHRCTLISQRSAAYALVLCALFSACVHFFPRMRTYFAALRRLISQRSALISALFFYYCSPLACLHSYFPALCRVCTLIYMLVLLSARVRMRSLISPSAPLRMRSLIFPSAPPLNRALIEPSIRAHCKNRLAPVFLEYCQGVSSCV